MPFKIPGGFVPLYWNPTTKELLAPTVPLPVVAGSPTDIDISSLGVGETQSLTGNNIPIEDGGLGYEWVTTGSFRITTIFKSICI